MLAGLNVAIALTTRNTEATFLIANFLTLPLIFTSSALLPLELLPGWLNTMARVNPVTYTINALRVLLYGPVGAAGDAAGSSVLQALLILLVLTAITLTLGTSRFRRVVS
jgi:ABC-2 type transport system permease protein